MFKKPHVGVDENFGFTHTHTHDLLMYSFLQGLFMNEQVTDKSSYHFVCNEFKLRRIFFIFGYFATLCVGPAAWCRDLI